MSKQKTTKSGEAELCLIEKFSQNVLTRKEQLLLKGGNGGSTPPPPPPPPGDDGPGEEEYLPG